MGLSPSIPEMEYSSVVDTKSGPIQGKVFTFDDKKYDAFLGIPFAEPPIAERRFKKPVPVTPWKETKECVQFGPRCPQHHDFFTKRMNIVGTDEAGCLTINVVKPREKSEEWPSGYPVMVWIHGGGFAVHSSSNYGDATAARNLCSKRVIFVSLNYRLGVFGFFTTGDDKCPGNLGLWDQTLGLKWVKENIAAFGGDPENITIFGQSAGGASVDLLSLSPHSRDLFHRVIPMAGTAECTFALRTKKDQTSISRQFARTLGWKGEDLDTQGLLDFISSQSADKLFVDLVWQNFKFKEAGNLAFVPNLDGDFFPKTVHEMRKDIPKKDVLTGTTDCEGLSLAFMAQIPFTRGGIQKLVEMMITEGDFGTDVEETRKKIIQQYSKEEVEGRQEEARKLADLTGDLVISIGAVRYAEKMAALGNNVYFYNFAYYNPYGFGIFRWILPFRAPCHCSELRYVLGKGILSKFQPNDEDLHMLEKMTTYFTNFAKYGNPNGKDTDGEWERHSAENPLKHFRIQHPESSMNDYYLEKRSEFWYEHVMPKHKSWNEVNGAGVVV